MIAPVLNPMPISLAAAFAAGVAGSVHCLAMCGGMTGALGMRARHVGQAAPRAFLHAWSYQSGRIASYALAGAMCGAFGGALTALFALDRVAFAMRIAAGLLLIAVSMRVLFGWRLLGGLERLGGRIWMRLGPLARSNRASGLGGSLLLGAIWGWLPCGLVYSMLVFAATAGGARAGAATMLLFGLGTWPAMLGGSWVSAQFWRISLARGLQTAAGVLLFAFGIATILAPLRHAHH